MSMGVDRMSNDCSVLEDMWLSFWNFVSLAFLQTDMLYAYIIVFFNRHVRPIPGT